MTVSLRRRRRPLAIAFGALTALLIGAGALTAVPAQAATSQVDVTWTNTNTWATGFQASIDVANHSAAKLSSWTVKFTFPHTLVSIWSATQVTSDTGTLSVTGPTWAKDLAVGAKTNFGLTATAKAGAALIPTGCTIVGATIPCSINGQPATGGNTPTPDPTPTPTPTPTDPPVSTGKGVDVKWTNTQDWTAGFQSSVEVANNSSVKLSPWKLKFGYGNTVVSLWDGVVSDTDGGFLVTAPSYATTLNAGAKTTFGLTSNKVAGNGQYPTSCQVVGADIPCAVNGGAATAPDPGTPTPTDPATPTDPGTPVTPSNPGDLTVSPYVDMGLWPTADLSTFSAKTGVNAVTAAFIVADRNSACNPTWAGYTAYSVGGSQDFRDNIAALQAKGGKVTVSFGGAVNNEIARVCKDPATLLAAYTKTVERFNVDRVDFDIEGADVSDSASNVRRATAVAALQKSREVAGKKLDVTLTLPVMPYGLLDNGQRTIKEFTAAGVKLSAVNLMTMDYGTGVKDMGQAAIDAAMSTAAQLKSIPAYAAWTDTQRLGLVAVTPMLGLNDTGEIFTLANATTVGQWAKANKLAGIGWWEMTRDQPCTGGIPAYMCSGVSNPQWSFSKAFVTATN